MALIKCPECNNEVSNKAETCPHCGIKIHTLETKNLLCKSEENIYSTPIFSTKSLYNKGYWTGFTIYSVCIIFLLLFFWFLANLLVAFIVLAIMSIITHSGMKKAALLQQSYIELYENQIKGVSSDKRYGYENGTTFTIFYPDITHIDNVSNQEIIIHTNHGIYAAQAFNCADKVIAIIKEHI